ncbi:MAG TPA: hypothetical protein VN700_02835 [Vicinamibacterales bacterium]|nr:hypothetical protein [Vicinamibacterales bacterium]
MRRYPIIPGAIVVIALVAALRAGLGTDLPERLTDEEFWKLSQESSEPGGYFRNADITNFTSNELLYQHVIPDLMTRVRPGRVYLGVGPEQNYTYMVATKPRMAIIFDIRRGNLAMQLMYKAIFELSADRADFVSMLFSIPRPPGLSPASSVDRIFQAFDRIRTEDALLQKNLTAIKDLLTKTRNLPLARSDLDSIDTIYRTFYASGYHLRMEPTYWDLMVASDAAGNERSYLATEAGFTWLKDLQSRNLVVPVVGDFGGPKAIRAVGQYLKARGGTVGAFYLSNVEQYLYLDGKWDAFCRNVATLPLDDGSTFIRSQSGGVRSGRGGGFVNSLGNIQTETKGCR